MALNFSEQAVNNRVAKVGVGAYLSTATDTPVTTAYTRLLGPFVNVELEGFEIDGTSGKLMYNPDDSFVRTFVLQYAGNLNCPSLNDIATIGIQLTRATVESMIPGSETPVTCRTAGSDYHFARTTPVTFEVGDLIEIQVKGDSSFTCNVANFVTTLTKFY